LRKSFITKHRVYSNLRSLVYLSHTTYLNVHTYKVLTAIYSECTKILLEENTYTNAADRLRFNILEKVINKK